MRTVRTVLAASFAIWGFVFPSATQAATIQCSRLAAGGAPIPITGADNRLSAPCDVTLAADLVIQGGSGAKLNLTPTSSYPYGLIIRPNGHRVQIEGVEFTFDRGFAIDILGSGPTSGDVMIRNTEIIDTRSSTVACSPPDEKRFGLILFRNGNVQLEGLEVRGPSGPAALQGGVAIVGSPSDNPSVVNWNGGVSRVQCGLPAASVRRPLMMNNVLVEAKGPCNMRPRGLSQVVQNGLP